MSIRPDQRYPIVGWNSDWPEEDQNLPFLEEISRIAAYALLWIQSWFDEGKARLLEAFNAEQILLDFERFPGPRHTPLMDMRDGVLQLLDVGEIARAVECISIIGWSDDSTIRRSGFDPVVARAVSFFLKQQLHVQFIDFRRQIRRHVQSIASVWFGVMQNSEYQRSKLALEGLVTSLVQHFDSAS